MFKTRFSKIKTSPGNSIRPAYVFNFNRIFLYRKVALLIRDEPQFIFKLARHGSAYMYAVHHNLKHCSSRVSKVEYVQGLERENIWKQEATNIY